MSKLHEVLRKLPALTHKELATIKAAVEHLMIKGGEPEDETLELFTVLVSLLGINLPFRSFIRTTTYTTWKRAAPGVLTFIEQTFPNLTKVQNHSVMTFLLNALFDDLRERNAPVTLGVVVNNLDRVPQVFEAGFPNYIRSGLTGSVLKAMGITK